MSIDELAKQLAQKQMRAIGSTQETCVADEEDFAEECIIAGLRLAAEKCANIQSQKLNASLDYQTERHMACEVCRNEILAVIPKEASDER